MPAAPPAPVPSPARPRRWLTEGERAPAADASDTRDAGARPPLVRPAPLAPVAIAGFVLDRERGLLLNAHGGRVTLRPQTMAVLLRLAHRPGDVVGKQALLDEVWRGRVVTEDSLVQCIHEIRSVLGAEAAALVPTLPRRGYLLELPQPGHASVGGVRGLALALPAPRQAPAAPLPFVGRLDELQRLAASTPAPAAPWAAAPVRVQLIEGEPGIGKSRLLHEAMRRAAAGGCATVSLRCFAIEAGVTCGALARLVAAVLVHADATALGALDAVSRAELAALVPTAAGRLAPLATLSDAFAEIRRARLLAAVVALVGAVAARRALVLGIDDAHWLDEASAVAVHALAESASRAAFALWATLRQGGTPARAAPLYQALLAHEHVARLPLPRLTADEVGELVRRAAGPQAIDRALLLRLQRESAGHPPFLRELLHALAPQADADNATGTPVPQRASLQEAIGARLQPLGAPARRLLETAAVLGRGADFDTLRTAAALAPDPALDALDELLAAGWLVPEGEAPGYVFTHDMLRETVYQALAPARRQALHARALRSLAAWFTSRGCAPEHALLALHARRAGLDRQAGEHLALAGDAARRLFQLGRAEALYGQALELADAPAALAERAPRWPRGLDEHRISLLQRRGAVRALIGRHEAAEHDLRRAIALAEPGEAPARPAAAPAPRRRREAARQQVQLQIELGVMLQRSNRLEDALAALERASQLARLGADPLADGQVRYWTADVQWMRECNGLARRHFEALLASAAGAPGAPLHAKALFGLAEVAAMDARPALAAGLLARALRQARREGDAFVCCECLALAAWIQVGEHGGGDYAAALRWFARCEQAARAADLGWYEIPCGVGRAATLTALGRFDEAEALFAALEQATGDADAGRWTTMTRIWQAVCHLERGDAPAALGTLESAERGIREHGRIMFAAKVPALAATALVRLGRADEVADPGALAASARAEELGYATLAALAARTEWLLARGALPEALRCTDEWAAEAGERGAHEALAHSLVWRADALLRSGRTDAARAEMRRLDDTLPAQPRVALRRRADELRRRLQDAAAGT